MSDVSSFDNKPSSKNKIRTILLTTQIKYGRIIFWKLMNISNILTYADGDNDLIDIAILSGVYSRYLMPIVQELLDNDLISEIES